MDGSGSDLGYEDVSSGDSVYFETECGKTFSVGGSIQTSLFINPQVSVSSTCELKSFDIVLHNSRKSCSQEKYMSMISVDRETGRNSAMHDSSSNGIYISFRQSIMEFMYKGWNLDVVVDTNGVRCVIFRYLPECDGTSDKSELKNLLCSLHFLTEASVYRSKLFFCLRNLEKALSTPSLHNTTDESGSHGIMFHTWGGSPLTSSTVRMGVGDQWLFTQATISGIYIAGCEVKDSLVNRFEEFNASFSVGGEFRAINFECKVLRVCINNFLMLVYNLSFLFSLSFI